MTDDADGWSTLTFSFRLCKLFQREKERRLPGRITTKRASEMRSIAMDGGEGNVTSEDESASGKTPTFCYWWWRSAPEFDSEGRAGDGLFPTTATELSALTRRQRVLKEMERLSMAAHESLDDLRHKLLSYRSGDLWVPAGGLSKETLNLPPVVTILLVGASGSGKSSLVNLMYSVLGRSGIIPFVRTSAGELNIPTF